MSFLRNLRHRLALQMVDHAVRAMPPARKPWAIAMQREIAFTENDGEAFTWACGCVWACYYERIGPMRNILLKSLAGATFISVAAVVAIAALSAVGPFGQRNPEDVAFMEQVRLCAEPFVTPMRGFAITLSSGGSQFSRTASTALIAYGFLFAMLFIFEITMGMLRRKLSFGAGTAD
jgi:hypothetical protein